VEVAEVVVVTTQRLQPMREGMEAVEEVLPAARVETRLVLHQRLETAGAEAVDQETRAEEALKIRRKLPRLRAARLTSLRPRLHHPSEFIYLSARHLGGSVELGSDMVIVVLSYLRHRRIKYFFHEVIPHASFLSNVYFLFPNPLLNLSLSFSKLVSQYVKEIW
jgi:hypothetical protein